MAVYYCHHCGNYIDDDWNPGEEHPDYPGDLTCPDCMDTLAEEAEEELNGEDYRKPKIPFDKGQVLFQDDMQPKQRKED
mgnify:CR=1 FL=1